MNHTLNQPLPEAYSNSNEEVQRSVYELESVMSLTASELAATTR